MQQSGQPYAQAVTAFGYKAGRAERSAAASSTARHFIDCATTNRDFGVKVQIYESTPRKHSNTASVQREFRADSFLKLVCIFTKMCSSYILRLHRNSLFFSYTDTDK